MSIEELAEVDGFDEATAEKTIKAAQSIADQVDSHLGNNDSGGASDLESLYLLPELKNKLIEAGIRNVQQLAVIDDNLLNELSILTEEEVEIVKAAVNSFFSLRQEAN